MKNKRRTLLLVTAVVLAAVLFFVRITITGNFEGVYLLRGGPAYAVELKDDLFLNEDNRYIAGIDFTPMKQYLAGLFQCTPDECGSSLYVAWNEKEGNGYIINSMTNGRKLLTCFSRFIDDDGRPPHGIFVGGGLPRNVRAADSRAKSETGMAYFDGQRWYHIWCNVNEALFSPNRMEPFAPSSWTFKGSKILHRTQTDLIMESSHEAVIDGVPLRIDRYAHFRAGETYFILSQFVTNIGDRPATYSYQYGDEPWLGDYGSSEGNVGWSTDGLHQYKGRLDMKRNRYAGFFDYGNTAAGEKHSYTLLADFLAWYGDERPGAYFANGPHDPPQLGEGNVPLFSNTRFVGLLWGPRTLQPDESANYTLAIGMADRDAKTGFPVLPAIDLKNFP